MKTVVETSCENCGKIFLVEPYKFKHGKGKTCSRKCRYIITAKKKQRRIERTCVRCGTVFLSIQSVIDKGHAIYCSRECHWPVALANCEKCGKEFRYAPSTKQRFCSKECAYESESRSITASQNTTAAWENQEKRRNFLDGIKTRSESEEWKNLTIRKGESNPAWKGGITKLQHAIRDLAEYKKWRKEIFTRDKHTCTICGAKSQKGKQVYLNADHIIPFIVILRQFNVTTTDEAKRCLPLWDTTNGQTLCSDCHRKTKTYGNAAKNMAKLAHTGF